MLLPLPALLSSSARLSRSALLAAPTRFLLLLVLLVSLLLAAPARANPIAPELAFPMQAQAIDEHTVEVIFDINKAYYLYGDKFRFEAEPDTTTFESALKPAGKLHKDDFFGEVETHRGLLRILLPLNSTGQRQFELFVTSQGCWDGGICYPPLTQSALIDLDASPQQTADTSFLGKLNSGGFASSGPDSASPQPSLLAGGDESGDIARLLGDAGLALILLSFFGFGLLLAFTPCTFPMIPILSSIIVGQGKHSSHGRAFSLSLAYVLGMALTYALAGLAAGLSGTMLSAALQNVWVLSFFALVFVLLSLSMFGFYELQMPAALQSRLAHSGIARKGGSLPGVAAMGALSALIVGPCVAAPLAGALLYIARTGDAVLGGLALFVMALGMGVPLLAVGLASRSLLPKVGPWMEGVKKAFGVLLLAVALWLLTPVLPLPALMIGWAALLLFSAVFLRALDPLPAEAGGWQRFWKACGVLLLLAGAAQLAGALGGARDPLQPLGFLAGTGISAPASQPQFERVASVAELDARLAESSRPVMLDFYADWCVSCKEMERFTFSDGAVAARMDNMLLLKADVTANSAEDKALLKRFELFGPPGIIFFDRQGEEIDGLRVVGYMKPGPFSTILDRALR